MRVLSINTVPTEINGITNVILNLYRAMDKTGVVIDYVSINDPDSAFVREIESYGGQLIIIPRQIRKPFSYFRRLYEVIRCGRYDLVHAHGNSSTLVLEMLAAKMAGCKVRIAHCHNTSCLSATLHKHLNPLFQRCCTHRLACGEAAGIWLYGKNPFRIVNNGVDTAHFGFQDKDREQVRLRYGIRDDETVLCHIGAFNQAKNQSFLIDVMKKIKQQHSQYRLMLLGDGPQYEEIKEKVQKLGITENVIFVGLTDQVEHYLSASDMLVMPSLYEGLPLSLIEAQANGLRCVVSENITRDVDKTGNVQFLPLEMGADYWAREIIKIPCDVSRKERSCLAIKSIKECGYDIYSEAEDLKAYYRDIIGRDDKE